MHPHMFRTEETVTRTSSSMYGTYYHDSKPRLKIQPKLRKILQIIDDRRVQFVENLAEMVAIRSVSGHLKYKNQLQKAVNLTEEWMIKLGIKYERFDIGCYTLENTTIKRPVCILGSLGKDRNKPTIGVYAHLDVRKPEVSEWKTDPWILTQVDGNLYGAGVASGKRTLTSWFNVILAFQENNMSLPVNLKFIIQCLHYYEHDGFEDFIKRHRQDFLGDITYIVVSDSEWIGKKRPCLIYGSIGVLHFSCTIQKCEIAKTCIKNDMERIFSKLHDGNGNVLIQEFNDYVKQVTPDEEQMYENITDFDFEEVRKHLPDHQQSWDKVKLLMSFWRNPSIIVSNTQECTCEDVDRTIIKKNFTVKIVPRQIVDVTVDQIKKHIKKTRKDLNIKHKVKIKLLSSSRTWWEDINDINFKAAARAILQIYKVEPQFIREDRDLKAVTILSVVSKKGVLVWPLGDNTINAGEANENIGKQNYFDGIKMLSAYLFQISDLLKEKMCN